MERQEASGVTTEYLQVTSRFLRKGTGFGAVAAGVVPASAHDLTRSSMTDE